MSFLGSKGLGKYDRKSFETWPRRISAEGFNGECRTLIDSGLLCLAPEMTLVPRQHSHPVRVHMCMVTTCKNLLSSLTTDDSKLSSSPEVFVILLNSSRSLVLRLVSAEHQGSAKGCQGF
jgi:hypothetical protein